MRKMIGRRGLRVRKNLVYLSHSKSTLTRVARTLRPAFEAERSWQISNLYAKIQSQIDVSMNLPSNADTALAHAQALLAKHSSRRRGRHQARITAFCDVVNAYSPIFESMAHVVPFGIGSAIWSAFAALITVVSRKSQIEQQFEQAMQSLSTSLRRAGDYRKIYPTKKMFEHIATLHVQVFQFVILSGTYFLRQDWKGSIARTFRSSTGFNADISQVVHDINMTSKNVEQEGRIAAKYEQRSIRTTVESMGVTVSASEAKICSMQNALTHSRLLHAKEKLVPRKYSAQDIFEKAKQQVYRRGRTTDQAQMCGSLLRDEKMLTWSRPTTAVANCTKQQRQQDTVSRVLCLQSQQPNDATISHVSLQILQPRPNTIVLHSMYQNLIPQVLPSIASSGNQVGSDDEGDHTSRKRGVRSMLQEAIFQLLAQRPPLVLEIPVQDQVAELSDEPPCAELWSLLELLIELVISPSATNNEGILWVIDRLDTCDFRSRSADNRLPSLLHKLQHLAVKAAGRLRVLIVTAYKLSSLDKRWDEAECSVHHDADEEEETERRATWLTLEYEACHR
ncbi:hypothetical protein LTR24_009556 [Lithohypha guttulata]|uniref:Fungal STAND N-terminal Goodbye domain-containing protein n=1 Tax=Lithohypha guttulata TaxID=1690604 RepID=A0ABR0JXF9_9EURO|nr:hypothetical protein LTR24_009556 [Lithohypha guttulata]